MFEWSYFLDGRFPIFDNPIIVAGIIVGMVLIIFYFIMYDDFETMGFIKAGIYIGLLVYGLLFMHYRNLNREFEEKHDKLISAAVISNAADSKIGKSEVALQPNLTVAPMAAATVPVAAPAVPSSGAPQVVVQYPIMQPAIKNQM